MGDSCTYLFPVALKWDLGPERLKQVKNKLLLHFQSKKKSGGGECELRDLDCSQGHVLIYFKEESVRDRVLQKQAQDLQLPGGEKLKLSVSLPNDPNETHNLQHPDSTTPERSLNDTQGLIQDPPVYKIMIENIQESCTPDMLNLLLENISNLCENQDFQVETILESNSAVVTFTSPIDIPDFIKRFSSNSRVKQFKLTAKVLEEITSFTVREDEKSPEKDKYNTQGPLGNEVVIGNIQDKCTSEMLILLLENTSNTSGDQDFYVEIIPEINSAVVTFTCQIDIANFIKTFSSNTRVNQFKLTVKPLEETKSIQVDNLPPNSSEEYLGLYFESSKNGGGQVQKVELIPGEDAAVVTFSDRKVVTTVLEKQHTFGKTQVSVYPYHPSLGVALYGKRGPCITMPEPIEFPMSPYILEFILRDEDMKQSIDKQLANQFCDITWPEPHCPNPIIKLCISRTKTTHLRTMAKIVRTWEDQIFSQFSRFISKYKVTEYKVNAVVWEAIKDEASGPMYEQVLLKPDLAKEKVFLTGLSKEVTKIEQIFQELVDCNTRQIERRNKSTTDTVSLFPALYEIMGKNGLQDRILKNSPDLKMEYDVSTKTVNLYGLKEEVLGAKCEILNLKQQLKTKNIHFDPQIKQFLQFGDHGEMSCLLLIRQNINAMFHIDGNDITLTGLSEKDLSEASKQINNELICKPITVEDRTIIQSAEWKSLTTHLYEVFNSKMCTVLIEAFPQGAENQVVITGIASAAQNAYKELHDFLEKNTPVQKDIHVNSVAVITFLKEEKKALWEDIQRNTKVLAKNKSISLNGSRLYVHEAATAIEDVLSSLCTDTLRIDKPGAKKFCINNEDMYITTARKKFNCVIHLQKDGEDEVVTKETKMVEPCSQITLPDRAIIAVYKDDLTCHRVDVVVNAADKDLNHIGGLALALLNAAGPKLKSDCDRIIREEGKLEVGNAVITGAGNLPCKQVIHTVGPKWDPRSNSQCGLLLQKAIKRSLEIAAENGHSSIAIPAVSSGSFGFPESLCAQNIVESIRQFMETRGDSSSINTVHLVDTDDEIVNAFTEALKIEFGDQDLESAPKLAMKKSHHKKRPSIGAKPRRSETHMVMTKEGVTIKVIHGNIQDAATDVIVNSVGRDLDLRSGAASRALFQKAGQSLQQLLHNERQGNSVSDGSVYTTDGCNLSCQKVIHVVAPQWDKGTGASEKMLRQLINTCLATTESNNLRSITFPAIGTGALHFPKNLVAALMFDEIFSFSSKNTLKHLQEVHFILHPSDLDTIQEFSNELQKTINANVVVAKASSEKSPGSTDKTSETNMGPHTGGFFGLVTTPTLGVHEMKIGSITYQVKTGDITKENTDVIVNSSNQNFTLKSGVSKAILEAAGQSVEDECTQLGSQAHRGTIITNGGNLLCKQILHICITSCEPETIKKIVKESLQECEKLQATSVAFPALGTGGGGVSAVAVADAMLEGVVDFAKSNSAQSIQTVKVVIFQQQMLNDFATSMKKKEGTNLPARKSWLSKFTSLFNYFKSNPEDVNEPKFFELKENIEPAIFHLCGESKENVKAASSWLKDLILKEQHENIITDDWILDFEEQEHQTLSDLQKRFQVTISFKSPGSTIKISGLTRDVFDISNQIQDIVKKIRNKKTREREAELCSNLVEWKYHDGTKIVSFDKMANMELEKASEKKIQSITIDVHGVDYTVNMELKTAMDPMGKQIQIERVPKHGQSIDLPPHWDLMNNDQLKVVPLKPGAAEYTDISKLFAQSCQMRIIKIERIQNRALWLNYQIKKQSIDIKNGNTNNEKQLFHGTAPEAIKNVNHNGYNRSFAGKNAAMYGNGTYFAVNAIYSAHDTYSRPDGNAYKYMYLARVLTGFSCVGVNGMVAPPSKTPNDPTDLYDSVTDNIQKPSMFVIFNDIQAYPEYLITFTK
ncbi:protein mono-ADP-ribosyltransferase PARP14-like [Discoglossus pictus]